MAGDFEYKPLRLSEAASCDDATAVLASLDGLRAASPEPRRTLTRADHPAQ